MWDGVFLGSGACEAGTYRSIGEALRAVEELATGSYASIAVAAGVYRERVTVPCGVEIVGAEDGLTVIVDPLPSPDAASSPPVRNPEALASLKPHRREVEVAVEATPTQLPRETAVRPARGGPLLPFSARRMSTG